MKLFFRFIRRYALCAATFGLFAVIFALVLSLYDLHAEAVLYASALCAAAAAVMITVKFPHQPAARADHPRAETGLRAYRAAAPQVCRRAESL